MHCPFWDTPCLCSRLTRCYSRLASSPLQIVGLQGRKLAPSRSLWPQSWLLYHLIPKKSALSATGYCTTKRQQPISPASRLPPACEPSREERSASRPDPRSPCPRLTRRTAATKMQRKFSRLHVADGSLAEVLTPSCRDLQSTNARTSSINEDCDAAAISASRHLRGTLRGLPTFCL
jgi:hypothetical protein